jgi:tRNA dimethylallyltransferase
MMSCADHNRNNLVIVLAGVTGVGKSDVAARLCAAQKGMIISADSVQAYRGVQIGANKPTIQERQVTPHILVDVADHTENYNAADWRNDAVYTIQSLLQQWNHRQGEMDNVDDAPTTLRTVPDLHRQQVDRQASIQESIDQARLEKGYDLNESILPVVCGGTMMYIQWLVHGRPDAMRPSVEAIEKAKMVVNQYQSNEDWEGAVEHVASLGQEVFTTRVSQQLTGGDWYRLRRTLEVAYTVLGEVNVKELVDKLYSGQREGSLESQGYDVRCFFLCPNDRMRHTKIVDRRCEEMILRGLLRETADLSVAGCLPEMAARAIGYRQVLDYFARGGQVSEEENEQSRNEEEAFEQFLVDFATATRRYAKKQMSWFRKDDNFLFVPVTLEMEKEERLQATASEIQRLCQLSREDYEQERDSETSISSLTKQLNEEQGKKMKLYQPKRHILKPRSSELEQALAEAVVCTAQMRDTMVDDSYSR